jgi:CRISPR-associated endonuclease Csn1
LAHDRCLFSFDIGTNSIGWCVLRLARNGEPHGIIDAGTRIYSDGREPKSGTSLAEGRRVARGMSRRRDRYKRRRKALLRTLVEFGLMPADQAARKALVAETNDKRTDQMTADVYALRARALDEKLPLAHVGRALFHLNQRRGFKSNRKTDKKDNEQGKIASGISRLGVAIAEAGARTLGEFLHKQRQAGQWVRVRPQRMPGKLDGKEEDGYGFYPERSFLQKEFDAIWDAQAAHHPDALTEERRAHLETVIFHQRQLKEAKVGRCSFNSDEFRLPKAHPVFQEFRLFKEVNELALVHPDQHSEKLTVEQRDLLVHMVRTTRKTRFSAMRAKILKKQIGVRFNKESDSRIDMKGDEVWAELADAKRFGARWSAFTRDEQWAIVDRLRDTEDPLALAEWLAGAFGLEPEKVDAIASARLPEGYGRLGHTALTEILEELKADIVPESEAAKRAGYDHALLRRGDGMDELPKYQEVLGRRIPPGTDEPSDPYDVRKGRITNPTVHIGLNQMKRVTNALVRKYGKPEQIAVELARDLKLNDEQKAERNREIAKNTRAAEARSEKLRALGHPDNGYNRLLLKLWEELDPAEPLNRKCVYTGKPIGIGMLFSAEVDVDHILPWSKTLDDSQANRILCLREANRAKGNLVPADVPQWQGHYDEILERAQRLPQNKRWRFGHDAMKKFKDEEGFLARQLTDTQYLSRMAHEYLAALYPDEEPDEWGVFSRKNHVRVIPGRMTEMLRRHWGLNSIISTDHNSKNRSDHRHHAIDAAVVGVTTRSLLQRIATVAGGREALALEETIGGIEPPWPDFRDNLKAVIDRVTVSHKPDHGTLPKAGKPGQTAGQLHNDTAYGFVYDMVDGERAQRFERGLPVVVRRKNFITLTENDIAAIRDEKLREALLAETSGLGGKDLTAALDRFRNRDDYKNIRHVRVTETLSVIPVRDAEGVAYKAYKGDANYRYDVWELPNGKWVEEIVSMFKAHQSDWTSKVHADNPAARKVLSLHQNDMVAYEHPSDGYTIGRVVKFSSGMVAFAANREGGALKARDADKEDRFRYFYKAAGAMKGVQMRQVRVDEIGQVFDSGPQDRQSRVLRKQKRN